MKLVFPLKIYQNTELLIWYILPISMANWDGFLTLCEWDFFTESNQSRKREYQFGTVTGNCIN